ncbi:MAG: hypothetical protein Q7J27_14870 [Syntrophales bacterium]|nr:hypothetical protein [Syntrophales bacterium]
MLKIECPECLRSFVWSDNMSLKGKCPTFDCEWRYDVQEEVKKSSARKLLETEKTALCPNCKKPIESKRTVCKNCGHFVLGSISFRKIFLVFTVIIILSILSLIYKIM